MDLPIAYSRATWQERRAAREEYARRQGGLCYWCKQPLSGEPRADVKRKPIKWGLFPETFRNHPVHLQHDHKTGMTEGAVHMRCNAVMWQYHNR